MEIRPPAAYARVVLRRRGRPDGGVIGARGDGDGAGSAGCGRARAVFTITTPATITAMAATVRPVSGSWANPQPRSTATTGFTYAYVATRVGAQLPSSHAYALNATIDPKMLRYATAAIAPASIAAQRSRAPSPETRPAARRTAPATSISIAAPTRTSRGSGAVRAYSDPAAQQNEPTSTTATAVRSIAPAPTFHGATSSTSPAAP